jgi:hypothetical protein
MRPETSVCWDMGDVHVISTADALCGSHAVQHNFQLFAQRGPIWRKFLGLLESPHRHSLLVAVIPLSHRSALNTRKSLGVPIAKNPEDWGQGIVQASWLGLRVLSTAHRESGSGAVWQCGENEAVSHHAWTTCVVVDEEAHVPRVLVNYSPKNDGTQHLLGKTTGPKSFSPKMSTQTLTHPYLSRHWFLDMCWLGRFVHLSTITSVKPVTFLLTSYINQDIRKGCPLSPTLFNLYIDVIIRWQIELKINFYVNNIWFSTLLFCDDYVIIGSWENNFYM